MATEAAFLVPPSLRVAALLLGDDGVTILASSEATAIRCPVCGDPADRVQSRYQRTLAALPWAGFAVRLRVRVRTVCCANPSCPRTVFAERLDGVAAAWARRTDRQQASLTAIAFALGGEAGARLARTLGMPVRPDALLRLIRRDPDADVPVPAVLGVDDWAIHTGLTYGTILVDRERHRPIDVLPDRSSEALANWLRAHPGVAVIARGRGGVYAEGSRDGAPGATQVADRWHLVDNLADVMEAVFRSKGACLKAAAAAVRDRAEEDDQPRSPPEAVYQGKRRHPQPEQGRERPAAAAAAGVARRRETHDRARALRATGATVAAIARTVGISRMTVDTYLREGPPQRKRRTVDGRPRVLAPHEPYLLERWEEGCRAATVPWRESRGQGFAHAVTDVQRFVAQLRREGPPPAGRPRTALTKPEGPPPRQVAGIVLRRPERRTEEQRIYLKSLCDADPAIATALDLGEDVLLMLRRREGPRLPAWRERAAASGVGDLARFARKPREDHHAVQAGLTLRWSNGQTEGRVNRLELLKRQGYGRAKADPLRRRGLRAA